MKPELYPLFLNLKNWPVAVVGAGAVSERRIRRLLKTGAHIKVVAPKATRQITRWAQTKKIIWLRAGATQKNIGRARLVFLATDDATLNARLARIYRRRNVLVNNAADGELSDFWVPAVARHRHRQLAIHLGVKDPIKAIEFRHRLEADMKRRKAYGNF